MANLNLGAVTNISINGLDASRAWLNGKIVWIATPRINLAIDKTAVYLEENNDFTDDVNVQSDRDWSWLLDD